jgi:hypothetical protein
VILLDADVLGRNRTGEETYVLNLLRELPRAAPDLSFAAVTRRPDLVPDGVEAIRLDARFQETRMGWSLPRLLRRVRPQLAPRAAPTTCSPSRSGRNRMPSSCTTSRPRRSR